MIITPDTLKALFTGFKKNFQDGLKMAESQYKEIATVIPSSTASILTAGSANGPLSANGWATAYSKI